MHKHQFKNIQDLTSIINSVKKQQCWRYVKDIHAVSSEVNMLTN